MILYQHINTVTLREYHNYTLYHLKKGQIFELTANSEESKVEHHCIEFISGITRTALISLFNGETMPVGFFKEQSISLSGNRLKYFRLQLLALNSGLEQRWKRASPPSEESSTLHFEHLRAASARWPETKE